MTRRIFCALIAPFLVPAFALNAVAAAPGFVTGSDAQQQVEKLTGGIHWYQDVNQAEAVAAQQHKMVLWIHMLGQMEGAT